MLEGLYTEVHVAPGGFGSGTSGIRTKRICTEWMDGGHKLSKFPFVDMKFCGEMSPDKSTADFVKTAMYLRVW